MKKKLPRVTASQVIRILERSGFSIVRQSGSHKILRNDQGKRVTIPYHAGKILQKKSEGTNVRFRNGTVITGLPFFPVPCSRFGLLIVLSRFVPRPSQAKNDGRPSSFVQSIV